MYSPYYILPFLERYKGFPVVFRLIVIQDLLTPHLYSLSTRHGDFLQEFVLVIHGHEAHDERHMDARFPPEPLRGRKDMCRVSSPEEP